ncbi:MAG: cystathionine gamma-lyase [Geodermatophilaceae bacterium]|nr:cystathionine gamma-lyase [Geodermatophilaceae bacterium]MDQ3456813.1 cystathionine gamma-lyase [Actinomycetota bacterium]
MSRERVSPQYGDGTRVVAAGQPPAVAGEPFRPGPVFAAPYHLGPDTRFYARNENPTWSAFEQALGALEGGPAVVFPSGMAAASAVLQSVLRPGDRVVVPSDGYYQVRGVLAEELPWYEVVTVPTAEVAGWAGEGGLAGATLVLVETPSNPGLDVCDLAAVTAAAQAAGCLVAVDNTMATPLGQRPLDFGVDFSLASDTKALTGHSDLVLGHVACRDAERAARLLAWRTRTGVVPGPFEVWLAHRSLGTLDLRLHRQATNARALAEALSGHPAIGGLRYPWLAEDPAHDLATAQMLRPSGVVVFDLADEAAVDAFLAASRLALAATSFGGLHTTVDRRARWGDAVAPGFVRVSCGVEDTADLVADFVAAADSLGSRP